MSKSRLIIVAALSLLMSVQARAADESLVLYLPFDEGAGTTATDFSSYNNPGTIVGNASWVAGQKGTALDFVNGSHVTVPEIPEYDVTAEASMLAWVKTTTVPNWSRVIDKSQWQTSGFDLVLTMNVGLPRLEFFVNNTTSLVDGTTIVMDNEWHFLVGTFGNKTLRMYVDGEMEGEAQSAGQVDINPNDWPLMIGAETSSNGGQQYVGSIDEVAMYNRELSADEVMAIFQNGMPARESAGDPQPTDKAVDVPRDVVLSWMPGGYAATHDVYLGTSADDVDSADQDNPMGILVSPDQAATEYKPADPLEYGQTYFWRIDEVNDAPDFAVFKGDVWSFTVEPYAYPITSLTVKASSQQPTSPAIRTIDGSGLDALGQHSATMDHMWVGILPAWIQYTFDKEYSLYELQVWNANSGIETLMGFGAKDVKIEYSTDGETWTELENVPEFAQGTGDVTYTANTVVDFGGVVAKHVKLTITASWLSPAMTSLSEVRFSYAPMQAFEPEPADGATGVGVETELNWRPGRDATSHTVYIDTNADALVQGETVSDHSYAPALDLGTTYYWKVDESGDAGEYPGEVWSFTTEDYASVDDFESYTDDIEAEATIWQTWSDGLEDPQNGGSQVGYGEAPFAEQTIVHSGRQSMPLAYDNTTSTFSQAVRTFDDPQNWTKHGITTLVLFFHGRLDNAPAPLYVKINNKEVPYSGGAATTMSLWKQWTIDLASLGVNLASVNSLTIGVNRGASGGTGTIYIDDIRLYGTPPEVVVPTDPGSEGLIAQYLMEGNVQDASGNGNDGTPVGDPTYVDGPAGYGQVLNMDGTNDHVDLPIGSTIATLTDTTVCTRVYFGGGSGAWQRIFDFGSGNTNYMFLCPRQGTSGNMRFGIRTAAINEQIVNSPGVMTVGWHHTAVTIDSQTMTISVYLDGALFASGPTVLLPRDLGNTTQNWLGRSQYTADAYFLGMLDDFRIYNRVLSDAELRYLAGDR